MDHGAAEQRDEADEGRAEAGRGMVEVSCHGVAATKHHGAVVRPSQLIASVRWTNVAEDGGARGTSAKRPNQPAEESLRIRTYPGRQSSNNLRQKGDGKRPEDTNRSRRGVALSELRLCRVGKRANGRYPAPHPIAWHEAAANRQQRQGLSRGKR